MNIPSLDMRILQNCNVNAGDDQELSEHSADDTDDPAEHLFKQGEIAVFRGTDGLLFNLLKVTRDYGYSEPKFRATFWQSLITLKMVPLDFERTDSGKEEQ